MFNVYAPLAHRLGIGHIKWELEDLSFRYLQPETYKKLHPYWMKNASPAKNTSSAWCRIYASVCTKEGIKCDVYGRVKHIYSIWRKMSRKNLDFSQIYDIRAVRVLVPEVKDCYAALGIVHGLWRHIPNEFDDYIANPKENGYRSLHTAVIGPEGKVLEVQIRSNAMHEDAELGVCAHWLYKGTDINAKDQGYEQKLLGSGKCWNGMTSWVICPIYRTICKLILTPIVFMYSRPKGGGFTTQGHAHRLCLSCAHRSGAQMPRRKSKWPHGAFDLFIKNGEQVEILTGSQAQPVAIGCTPTAVTLTPAVRAKIAHWFKLQARDDNMEEGKRLLMRELERLDLANEPLAAIATAMNVKKPLKICLPHWVQVIYASAKS